ncbi:outer membrane receptor protein involved in Fe transport [Runella defluvii]|uniref:Outer membrane receptor protein involved in Fe transport n=1 Tax=Runella defluvii TaxID=370973 RepID=A0A7W5ZGQ9_9BACT|nr:TonB-dependent receptor [Runella defluvii]MBB3837003.1 outer membrane receptor protein involved in Fe transport [Runella defluvii]
MLHKLKQRLLGLCFLITLSLNLNAQVIGLDTVTVSGTRMFLKKNQVPQKIEVLSSRDLELTPANDIADFLKKLAALNIVQYPHGFSYVNVRGFAPNTFHGSNSIQPETSVLINGRPAGTVNLAVLDRGSIDRIEVLKGPSAAMYGANTMGGVINIITKKSQDKIGGKAYVGYGTWNTLEVGADVGGKITPKLDFDLAGTFFNRGDNYKIGKGNFFRNAFGWRNSTVTALDQTTLDTPDDVYDGVVREYTQMQNYSIMARLGYQISKNWRIDAMSQGFATNKVYTIGDMRTTTRDQAERKYNTSEVALTGKVGKHSLLAKAYISKEYVGTLPFVNATTGQEFTPYKSYESSVDYKGFQLQDEVKISEQFRLAFGTDYYTAGTDLRYWNAPTAATGNVPQERASSSPNGLINDFGIFAQGYASVFNNRLILNPSFRTDFVNYAMTRSFGLEDKTNIKSESKTIYSPNFGAQINLTKALAIHANVGTAFRYAVANQIAGYFETFTTTNPVRVNVTLGNPDLKNENSLTWETGLRFGKAEKGFYLDATYFNTKVDDRIITISDASKVNTDWQALDGKTYKVASYRTYANANYSKLSGIEMDGYYDFGAINQFKKSYKLFFNATKMLAYDDYIKSTDPASPDTKSKARHVADLSLGGGFEFDDLKRFSVRLSGRYMGAREYVNFNDVVSPQKFRSQLVTYPPYLTLDLVANLTIYKKHTVSLRVNNLTDENYYELRYQPMPGRNTSLRYTFRF